MEAKRFGKVYNIRCVCCYGGGSKWEQTKALEGNCYLANVYSVIFFVLPFDT